MRPSQGLLQERLFEGLIKTTWSSTPIPLRLRKPSPLLPKQWAPTLLLSFELLPPLKKAAESLEGQKWLMSVFWLRAGECKGQFVTLCCVRNWTITIWGSYKKWLNLTWDKTDTSDTPMCSQYLSQRPLTVLARLWKGKHQRSEAKQILVAPKVLVLLLTGCVPSLCISISLSLDVDKMFSLIFSSSDTLWYHNSSSKFWEAPIPWSEWIQLAYLGTCTSCVLLGKHR